jgi:D-alanyl-D-alanine carboxypeptidase
VPTSAFTATVSAVTAAELGSSWRPGCPVAPEGLRLLRLSYWGFDGQPHVGSLVVAASVTTAVTEAFRTLYDQRFPIRRMEPVDVYGADDDASMAADNTSAFNCRPAVAEGPPHWSNHAYGLAIDVNPVENPYLLGGRVLPPAGAEFVDRSVYRPGMAVAGGVVTSAFAAVGWGWGGVWDSPDYQHFSANGG